MKYFFYTSLIFSLYTHQAFGVCNLVSYPQIIKINKSLDTNIIKSSDCQEDIQIKFVEFISATTGTLNSKHLSNILKNEHNVEINILPSIITVKSLDEKLSELLRLSSNTTLTNLASIYGQSSILLDDQEMIRASCQDCESAGNKNIKILFNQNTIWVTANLLIRRKALTSKAELNPHTEKLSPEQFEEIVVFDNGMDHHFNDVDNIRYFKTNKKIPQGSILKTNDLTPLLLVKPGQTISIMIEGENISLQSTGIARSAGKLGDTIDVINAKTNKKVSAQVVDFNTVKVTL
jgi:flagella basal body P-ring formation protein FlgA